MRQGQKRFIFQDSKNLSMLNLAKWVIDKQFIKS